MDFIKSCVDINELLKVEFKDEKTEYRGYKVLFVRNFDIKDIMRLQHKRQERRKRV